MFYTRKPSEDWRRFLAALTRLMNASPNASTGQIPDQVVMGFTLNDSFGVISSSSKEAADFESKRKLFQNEARDCLALAKLAMKIYYDKKHMPLLMNPGDKAFLQLKQGYRIQGIKPDKFSMERVGPFEIIRRVSPLAYELKLPSAMKIHPVVSVTHLEPAPHGDDPFNRPKDDPPPPVEETDLNDEWRGFRIETLIDRRLRRYGRGKKIIEYLVKWKGYGPEFNEWYGEDLLDNAVDLMLEYESRKDTDPERIAYLRKLIADQDADDASTSNNNASTPNTNASLPVKRGPGRPKGSKNKKTEP